MSMRGHDETLQVPAKLDDVDVDFLTSALQSGGWLTASERAVSFEKVVFGREKGYLGDKCLLKTIAYEGLSPASAAPTSIFVKLFPTELVVPLSGVSKMWNTEKEFLTRTLRELPDQTLVEEGGGPSPGAFKAPQVFFFGSDSGSPLVAKAGAAPPSQGGSSSPPDVAPPPRMVFLMEAISAKPCDILTAMPVEHAFRAAQDLAVLHAPYWGWSYAEYREDGRFEQYPHMDDEGRQRGYRWVFETGSKLGLGIFGKDGALARAPQDDPIRPEMFAGYVELWRFWEEEASELVLSSPGWEALMSRLLAIPTALVHYDFHCENMLCMSDGSNVYVDFQSVCLGPGVSDVAWLLQSSLRPEVRREHEKAIVRVYCDTLRARGVQKYEFEQCWDDYVLLKVHGLRAGMLGAGMFAAKHFEPKTGIFATDPAEDAVLERKRNNALFFRVVEDLRHSAWVDMLRAFL